MNELDATANDIAKEINLLLSKSKLFFRIFHRGKAENSIKDKLEKKRASNPTYKLQDAIGIRVISYFKDDIKIIEEILNNKYETVNTSKDKLDSQTFTVYRHNIVYKIPEYFIRHLNKTLDIDLTFEVQLRTIFSEGWHELDHDFRYKRRDDWSNADILSRNLNGIMASLETSEWALQHIINDLAYSHYKQQNWEGMLINTLRLKLPVTEEEKSLITGFTKDTAKEFLKIDREDIILTLLDKHIPISLKNIIYVWNLKKDHILDIPIPESIKQIL